MKLSSPTSLLLNLGHAMDHWVLAIFLYTVSVIAGVWGADRMAHAVLDREKPAHTSYELTLLTPMMQLIDDRGAKDAIRVMAASDIQHLALNEHLLSKLFQFRDSSTLVIQVKGQHLRGAVKPHEGTLVIESNAGTFKLKVLANVPIVPFPGGALPI